MIDGVPVVDAIVHPHNFHPSNYANKWGKASADLVWGACFAGSPVGYRLPQEQFQRDWTMDNVATATFIESYTDVATTHVLPIGAFRDGACSFAKAMEAKERWPDRFVVYAGVDALAGPAALDELTRQVEALDPVGVKLYPNSWPDDGDILGWLMDDPEVGFPVFERARDLGLGVVAIHKALPLGPVPLEYYRVDDIDRAAIAFPDLKFEIVHGGLAFVEETAWQLARFPNVFVNLELTTHYASVRPGALSYALAALMSVAGEAALERICWGTGGPTIHSRPQVEAFWRKFNLEEADQRRFGVGPLTAEHKAKILGLNYARLIGMDLDARLARIADDEFARRRAEGLAPPYSTTEVGSYVI